jgi:very-short-patch-repair endonuclease
MRQRSHLAALRTPDVAANARELRKNMTDAERRLWYYLRAHRLEGRGFRRQVPLGPYVADFLCEKDEERTAWLNAQGYRVVRFWNHDAMGNMEGVWEVLSRALLKK